MGSPAPTTSLQQKSWGRSWTKIFFNYTNLIHESCDRLGMGGRGVTIKGIHPSLGLWAARYGSLGRISWEGEAKAGKRDSRTIRLLIPAFLIQDNPPLTVPDQYVNSVSHPFYLHSCCSLQHQEPAARIQEHWHQYHTCANGVTKRPRAGIKVSTCELEVVNICANFQIHWDGQEIWVWGTNWFFVIFFNNVHSDLEQQESGLVKQLSFSAYCVPGTGLCAFCELVRFNLTQDR